VSTRSSHTPARFTVDLPAGGKLQLHSVDEVELWEQSAARYVKDYALRQQNDLLSLGAILSQVLAQFRAQQRMNGMTIERDGNGSPTGRYLQKEPSSDLSAAQSTITKAAEEIRELEKALGVDKKTREAGGQHTVANYITELKSAAREYGDAPVASPAGLREVLHGAALEAAPAPQRRRRGPRLPQPDARER
jgi:hypothetical protein